MQEEGKQRETKAYAAKKPYRALFFVLLGLVIVAALVISTMFLTDRAVLTLKSPAEKIIKFQTVCTDDDIVAYNDASVYTVADNGDSIIDTDKLTKLADDIKQRDAWAQDPTCQSIIFWAAWHNNQPEIAKAAYDALVDLHAKGIFANNNLRDSMPLNSYSRALERLQQPEETIIDGENG